MEWQAEARDLLSLTVSCAKYNMMPSSQYHAHSLFKKDLNVIQIVLVILQKTCQITILNAKSRALICSLDRLFLP